MQDTISGDDAVLDADTLQDRIEGRKWSPQQVADEFNIPVATVERAIDAHDIDYRPHATAASTSGPAKKLVDMDPDDLPLDDTPTDATEPSTETEDVDAPSASVDATLTEFTGGESA